MAFLTTPRPSIQRSRFNARLKGQNLRNIETAHDGAALALTAGHREASTSRELELRFAKPGLLRHIETRSGGSSIQMEIQHPDLDMIFQHDVRKRNRSQQATRWFSTKRLLIGTSTRCFTADGPMEKTATSSANRGVEGYHIQLPTGLRMGVITQRSMARPLRLLGKTSQITQDGERYVSSIPSAEDQ